MTQNKPLSDYEIAGIISVLAKYWQDKEVRLVMRFLSSKVTNKIGKEETQQIPE